jgi:diguanylate cyclase (GGDEF)-like protein
MDLDLQKEKNARHIAGKSGLRIIEHKPGDLHKNALTEKDGWQYFSFSDHATLVQELHNHIHFDALTGLPNRNSLNKKISSFIATGSVTNFAVLFLNIDSFRHINEMFGHSEGDSLLQLYARKIDLLKGNKFFASHFSGDTFCVVLSDYSNSRDLLIQAQNLLSSLSGDYSVKTRDHDITTCIGIAQFPEDGTCESDLIRKAEIALSRAKKSGKGTITLFDEVFDTELRNHLRLENNLKKALSRKEFYIVYQPQYEFKTGRISGFETLIRWNNKDHGNVSPVDFIPVAERTGNIIGIGEYVLREAFCFLRKMRKIKSHITVSVNISAVQLMNPEIISLFISVIKDYPEDASFLKIEITETVGIRSFETVAKRIKMLKDMGIKISLDDFGTGYSSLSYLIKLPFDELKIDKSFIDEIDKNPQKRKIMSSLITLAHSFKLDVVAEGIENQEQMKILEECGCNKIQGYLIGKPISEEESLNLLQRQKQYLHNK